MKLKIWGVRGSLPTPMSSQQLREKMRLLLEEAAQTDISTDAEREALLDQTVHSATFGGNTSCIEVSFGNTTFVLDSGSGVRGLGAQLMSDGRVRDHKLHVFFTHFHWDHICGFPFFAPIFIKDLHLNVWSGRSDSEELLAVQMGSAHFPVKWNTVPADITCRQLPELVDTEIDGAQVRLLPLIHPDKAYGYRITAEGCTVCYLTDTEVSRNPNQLAAGYADFVDGADVVIVDAQYGFLEYHERINWGHSTIYNWIDFFADADIGELVIFHHDPMADDLEVARLLEAATKYRDLVAPQCKWVLSAAYEGQTWNLQRKT